KEVSLDTQRTSQPSPPEDGAVNSAGAEPAGASSDAVTPVSAENPDAATKSTAAEEHTSAEAPGAEVAEPAGYVEVDLEELALEADQPESSADAAMKHLARTAAGSTSRGASADDAGGIAATTAKGSGAGSANESAAVRSAENSTAKSSASDSGAETGASNSASSSDSQAIQQADLKPTAAAGADTPAKKTTRPGSMPSGDVTLPASPLPGPRQERSDFAKTSPLERKPRYKSLSIKNRCGLYQYTLPFEESLLVPDVMPDMAEILFAEGKVNLAQAGKTNYEKGDALSGDITVYAVYRPDTGSESPVDVIKSAIAFKTDKCWEGVQGTSFKVEVRIKEINAEMINERKFTAKGSLLISFTALSERELNLFEGMDDDAFMQLETSIKATALDFEAEDSTEISQEINIKEDQPAPAKILKETIRVVENHKQITSEKLVINATIHSEILYVGEKEGEDALCCLSNKTDFTQFVPLSGEKDIDLIKASFIGDDLKIAIEDQDRFLLSGQVKTLICGYKNMEVKMVSDAYHKEKDLKFDLNTQELSVVKGTVSGEISAREVVNLKESQGKPKQLLCGCHRLESIKGTPERGRLVIEGTMQVKILALDEDHKPFLIESALPLRGSLEMPVAGDVQAADIFAAVREFWFDEINSRQLEINVSVAIDVWVTGSEAFSTIENLCYTEKKAPSKRIPMALYVVGRGDTLWEIAKRYKSDIGVLAELNDIDAESPLPEGMKLFVMK
ncbi:MAG: DUF3794 domain-containing protein, partial [Bacillota bacterium]|nr:DUF3794 domain-containing protein [Bacillota bacterium]